MSINYSELDWPTLPENMHLELIEFAQSAKNIRPTTRRGGDKYHHYAVPTHVEEWCREHLPITDKHQVILQRFFNTRFIPRHIDGQRSETCNYVLSKPGAMTRWFDNDEHLVETVVFPRHKWYTLKVDVWHDVINIETDRLALSIHIPFFKWSD